MTRRLNFPIRITSRGWLIITLLFTISLKMMFERSAWGSELEHASYVLLHKRLRSAGTSVRPTVLVIDISKIQPETWEHAGEKGIATSRRKLKNLISAILELHPRSIGIDIDFSPEDGQSIHPDDPEFFEWCLQQTDQTRTPILLGVYRTQSQLGGWLGNDRYMKLAATIATPTSDHGRMIDWLAADQTYAPLPSMPAALAGVRFRLLGEDESLWHWLFRSISVKERQKGLRSAESVIDLSPLQRIEEDVMPALDPAAMHELEDKVRNRMILIGDCKNGDTFDLPGFGKAVPGVFLHACAANTIANEPLYELTPLGKLGMDVFLALGIYGMVKSVSRMSLKRKHPKSPSEYRLNLYVTTITVAVVVIISVGFVHWSRLLWTDFVLVGLVLLGHSALETMRHHKALSARSEA